MTIEEIVKRAEKDAFVVECTHEPLCEEYRLAREMAYAVARAVVEECAKVACYLCREFPGEFDHAHDRPADLIRALAAPSARKVQELTPCFACGHELKDHDADEQNGCSMCHCGAFCLEER